MFKSLLVLTLCFSMNLFAKGSIDIGIVLTPMGDFVAKAPLKGHMSKKGSMYKSSKISMKIKKLKTGIELRDKHTKKYMLVKKHPVATLTKVVAKGGKGKGMLSFMGKKKKIKFSYSIDKKNFVADFKLSAKKWGIKDIDYMGVGVEDDVTVKAIVPIK